MKNSDVKMHVRGKSIFVDDILPPEGLLHAVLFTSPVSKGKIKRLDVARAKKAEDVAGVFTWKDVPGKNFIGHVVLDDQELFAVENLEYIGQPIAMVVASTKRAAVNACKLIKLEVEELEAVYDPREAYKKRMIHGKKRVLVNGDTEEGFKRCVHIAEGRADCGPQEHFYFETQRSLAIPMEDGAMKVCASVQSPGIFHRHIAEVIGVPMHKVELEIRRLGGGFGGKESTAVWVAASAVAAKILNRPVKMVLSRNEDIATTGKRHPVSFDYKIGLDSKGNILAYDVDLYQHAGACTDISLAVLERSFLHATGSYRIQSVRITAVSCRTNIPPNNAFRGFGVPQAAFGIESALLHAAEVMGVDVNLIKKKNLLRDGDSLPYGMRPEKINAITCWDELDKKCNFEERISAVDEYNRENVDTKRGIAIIPVCFGISFAQTALNQASALVNIYVDGSVSISAGAVEMGQGVNAKIALIAARVFSISTDKVRVDTTNTSRIPNASPTSASTGADLNGMAAKMACEEILKRLKIFVAKRINHDNPEDISINDETVYLKDIKTDYRWEQLIKDAHWDRTDLSCHGYYATPGLYLDREINKGRPFSYYSYGTSVTEVLVDCARGTYDIESIDVVHDVGTSISSAIDKGQVEGAIVQAVGWSTIEQIRYEKNGKVLTGVNAYKIPDIKLCPEKFNVYFLENSSNPFAVCNSKAVGEPPFIHGIGAYFAILHALRSIRKDKLVPSLPLTPEKVFMYIHEC